MFAIKVLGGCILAGTGWYGGVIACNQVRAHRVALGETISLLKILEEEIGFQRSNLNALYQRLATSHALPSLGMYTQDKNGQVSMSIGATFQTLQPPTLFSAEEKVAFTACFTRLGYTNAAQECERLIRYRTQFETNYRTAMQAEKTALAIDRKVGFAIGSMVALVLL